MCGVLLGETMAASANPSEKEHTMSLIQVKVIAGVFTTPQKQEIVERLTESMVAIEGECMRQRTWCVLEEVASGQWGVGGELLTADDIRALGRADTHG
jgi:4-oxalocrotonate tautomerase